jgi:hypothetical protein
VKYKAIKSAAHNFGDSFASGLNYAAGDYVMSHLARRALTSGRTEMIVDLLTGEAAPIELVAPPVEQCLTARLRWFPQLLASQRIDPAVVRAARMRIAFDTRRCTAAAPSSDYAVREMPFDCWVEVVDDHDRTHVAHFRRWWPFLADGPGFAVRAQRRSLWRRVAETLSGRSWWRR